MSRREKRAKLVPGGFALSVDLVDVLHLERVEAVSGGVRVLDVLVDDGELVRGLVEDVDAAVELLVVSVDRVLAGLVARLQEAVGHLDLQQVVQHLDLALDEVRVVQNCNQTSSIKCVLYL